MERKVRGSGRSMTKVTDEAIAALGRVPYLRALPPDGIAALAGRCALRDARRGATIFEEGAEATGLWVILAGRVKLVRTSPRGREQVLHVESAGATLAEVALFDGGGYVASAVAAEDSRLLFVPRDALVALCLREPRVALGVIDVLARRLRTFASLIEDLSLRDVTSRLARFLLAESRRTGSRVVLTGTRDEVAARLGTVRELVSRALSRLGAAGVIEVRGRQIMVKDAARLAAAGQSR